VAPKRPAPRLRPGIRAAVVRHRRWRGIAPAPPPTLHRALRRRPPTLCTTTRLWRICGGAAFSRTIGAEKGKAEQQVATNFPGRRICVSAPAPGRDFNLPYRPPNAFFSRILCAGSPTLDWRTRKASRNRSGTRSALQCLKSGFGERGCRRRCRVRWMPSNGCGWPTSCLGAPWHFRLRRGRHLIYNSALPAHLLLT